MKEGLRPATYWARSARSPLGLPLNVRSGKRDTKSIHRVPLPPKDRTNRARGSESVAWSVQVYFVHWPVRSEAKRWEARTVPFVDCRETVTAPLYVPGSLI